MEKIIKIYTLPTCAYCQLTKEYFKAKNLLFEEIDVLGNEELIQEIVAKTGQTTLPVVEYGEKLIVGYQKQLLDEVFG